MMDFVTAWWPDILAALSLLLGVPAAIHAIMTKTDAKSAAGWVALIVLSPLLGALIYSIAGINRIRRVLLSNRRRIRQMRDGKPTRPRPGPAAHEPPTTETLSGLVRLGDAVSGFARSDGNRIRMLADGDDTFRTMAAAIDAARHTIWMESYIFRKDEIGTRIAERLCAAKARGVDVRVIIDAVGARYTVPSIVGLLRRGEVPTETFNGRIITGLRLPYANMRTHRKILIADGQVALTGGMNISAEFSSEIAKDAQKRDTHFILAGQVVDDLASVWWDDWAFVTGRQLSSRSKVDMRAEPNPDLMALTEGGQDNVCLRVVASGPDATLATNQKILLGACSVATRSIRLASPYFLPTRELIAAFETAMNRGVDIDIVVPGETDNRLVDAAMTAQFDQVLGPNCRIIRSKGSFNHSKLMAVDGLWAFVGSSNIDPRSLRLNFEVDLEVHDAAFAHSVEQRISAFATGGTEITLKALASRPFINRLGAKTAWLASPYM